MTKPMRRLLLMQLLVAAFFWGFALANVSGATGAPSPIGLWKNEDATFEIFENDGKLGARIVALREPTTPEGKEKTDIHNPDPSKRDRPIIGLVFMSGFIKKSDVRWENGTIYDPKSGNTYSCFMELEGSDKIKVRGFIGISLIGRTDIWSRASGGERR
jgi:uncharacterized protein (DUF2147 family)